jgi:nucleotide-binding universal stress UspA family protein
MYQRILIATDGSTLSKKAVRSGIGLAKSVGAELVAVNVIPRYPISYFEGAITVSPDHIAKTEKKWADKGQEVVDGVCGSARAEGLKCKAVIVRSDLVAEAILSTAKKNKCDLIVMASHGRKGIKRVLLGSETQQVLTHSEIPVLVLR